MFTQSLHQLCSSCLLVYMSADIVKCCIIYCLKGVNVTLPEPVYKWSQYIKQHTHPRYAMHVIQCSHVDKTVTSIQDICIQLHSRPSDHVDADVPSQPTLCGKHQELCTFCQSRWHAVHAQVMQTMSKKLSHLQQALQ